MNIAVGVKDQAEKPTLAFLLLMMISDSMLKSQ